MYGLPQSADRRQRVDLENNDRNICAQTGHNEQECNEGFGIGHIMDLEKHFWNEPWKYGLA